ncbi:MAG: hypothetical protein ACXVZ3_01980 [Gaiellaceae bacterium]
MAETAPSHQPLEDDPPTDPNAVGEAYRFHRARRRAHVRHRQEKRKAGLRYYVVLLMLLLGTLVIAVTIWSQVRKAFGI